MRVHLLERFPEAEVELFIVWVDVFTDDSHEAALESAAIPVAPRVQQFFDAERRAARALAPITNLPTMARVAEHIGDSLERLARFQKPGYLHGEPSAYDTVFFYERDAVWGESPPEPMDWITQLRPEVHVGLDPERSFWEFDFYAELERRGTQHYAPGIGAQGKER